ncbi:hypothetical protein FACS189472_10120 [Alphaproteobacteria bacterium]|nr:hypothetical protein FACS189472_10120 [Alphaproteobacteria bacterium]
MARIDDVKASNYLGRVGVELRDGQNPYDVLKRELKKRGLKESSLRRAKAVRAFVNRIAHRREHLNRLADAVSQRREENDARDRQRELRGSVGPALDDAVRQLEEERNVRAQQKTLRGNIRPELEAAIEHRDRRSHRNRYRDVLADVHKRSIAARIEQLGTMFQTKAERLLEQNDHDRINKEANEFVDRDRLNVLNEIPNEDHCLLLFQPADLAKFREFLAHQRGAWTVNRQERTNGPYQLYIANSISTMEEIEGFIEVKCHQELPRPSKMHTDFVCIYERISGESVSYRYGPPTLEYSFMKSPLIISNDL